MQSLSCDLYTVVRTDRSVIPWARTVLSYAPTNYPTAIRRADYYQRTFDPSRARFDYRVTMVS